MWIVLFMLTIRMDYTILLKKIKNIQKGGCADNMKNLKKLTILHSNDLHGDFLAETVDEKLIGGVSRLSGYINKVRNEEKNVIYAIAGDMFRGSLIDSEFQGISTIQIMNLLAPDVVTIGNHEVDYGLARLLFLEKCATFPIINANMYLNTTAYAFSNPILSRRLMGCACCSSGS